MDFDSFKKLVLKNAEDENISERQIQALVAKYFRNKPVPFIQSMQSFVVRCSVNKPGEVFKNVSRCSYPPNEIKDTIEIQRANYPGQQLFYCTMPTDSAFSTASLTCVLETAQEHIDDFEKSRIYCTVSRWTNCRPLNLWTLPFSDESCKRNRDFDKMRADFRPLISDTFEDSKEILEGLEFISDAFCSNSNKRVYYRLTSAFYNFIQFHEKLTHRFRDGIMYPSANTEKGGLNLALKKELVDQGVFKCDYVAMLAVQRMPNNPKEISVMPCTDFVKPESDGTIRFSYLV